MNSGPVPGEFPNPTKRNKTFVDDDADDGDDDADDDVDDIQSASGETHIVSDTLVPRKTAAFAEGSLNRSRSSRCRQATNGTYPARNEECMMAHAKRD